MHNLEAPQERKGHKTRKPAISIAKMAGIDPQLICQASMWALLVLLLGTTGSVSWPKA